MIYLLGYTIDDSTGRKLSQPEVIRSVAFYDEDTARLARRKLAKLSNRRWYDYCVIPVPMMREVPRFPVRPEAVIY